MTIKSNIAFVLAAVIDLFLLVWPGNISAQTVYDTNLFTRTYCVNAPKFNAFLTNHFSVGAVDLASPEKPMPLITGLRKWASSNGVQLSGTNEAIMYLDRRGLLLLRATEAEHGKILATLARNNFQGAPPPPGSVK